MVTLITDLYETKIEIKDSNNVAANNFNINDNDIKVIITLVDFNKQNVGSGVALEIKVDKGTINDVISSGTGEVVYNAKEVTTVKTNSNGQVILNYQATEYGLVTFTCNNSKQQIFVSGWEEVSLSYTKDKIALNSSGATKFYVNPMLRMCSLYVSLATYNYPISNGTSSYPVITAGTFTTLTSNYTPKYAIDVAGYYPDVRARLGADGVLTIASKTAHSNAQWGFYFIWNY